MGDETLVSVSGIKIVGPPDLVIDFTAFLKKLPDSILQLIREISNPFCTTPPQTCPPNSIVVPHQPSQLRTPFVLRLDPQDVVTVCPIDDSMVAEISHVWPGYDEIYGFLKKIANMIQEEIIVKKSYPPDIKESLTEIKITCSTKNALVYTPSGNNKPIPSDIIALGQDCELVGTEFPKFHYLRCRQYAQYTLSAPGNKGTAMQVFAIAEKALSQQCTVSTNNQPPVEAIPSKQHDNNTWFGMTLLVSLSMRFLSEITKTIRFNDKSNTGKLVNLLLEYSKYIVLIGLFYAVPTSALLWITTHFFNTFLTQHISSKFKKKFSEFLVFAITQLLINYTHQKENDFTATVMILLNFSELVLGDTMGYYLARAVTSILKEKKSRKSTYFQRFKSKDMTSTCSGQDQKSEPENSPTPEPTTNTTLNAQNAQSAALLKTSLPKEKKYKFKKPKKRRPEPSSTTPTVVAQAAENSPIKAIRNLNDDEDTAKDTESLSSNGQSDDPEDEDTHDVVTTAPPATITITATPHMTVIHCDGDTQHPNFIGQLMQSISSHNVNNLAPVIVEINNKNIPLDSQLQKLLSITKEIGVNGSITGGAALQIIECFLGKRPDKKIRIHDIDCMVDPDTLEHLTRMFEANLRPYKTVTGEPRVSCDFSYHGLHIEVSAYDERQRTSSNESNESLATQVMKKNSGCYASVKSCLVATRGQQIKNILPNVQTLIDLMNHQFSLNPLHKPTPPKWIFIALAMICEGYEFVRSDSVNVYDNACSLQGFGRFHCVTKYFLRYGSDYLIKLDQAKTTSGASVLGLLIPRTGFDYTHPSYTNFFDGLIAITKGLKPKDQYTALIIALIAPLLFEHAIPDPKNQDVFSRYINNQLTMLGIQINRQEDLPEYIVPVNNAAMQCIQICTNPDPKDPVLLQIQQLLQHYLVHNYSSAPEASKAEERPKRLKNILIFTDPEPKKGYKPKNHKTCLLTKKLNNACLDRD